MSQTSALDRAIDAAIGGNRIVGTVVIVMRDGKPVYRRAAGLADREAGAGVNEHTLFRLASVTKPIVTGAVMLLIEQGRMKLDDPVTQWLPEFRPKMPDGSRPTITIRHLLTHTSGLGYGLGANPEYRDLGIATGSNGVRVTLKENIRRLGQSTLLAAPGSKWIYSLATDVLGGVIAEVVEDTLQSAMERLVFKPLGMCDTAFYAKEPARLAAAYADGQPVPVRMADGHNIPIPPDMSVTFTPSTALDSTFHPSAVGGLVGTAEDVARFFETIRAGGAPLLKSTTVAEMLKDQVGPQAQAQGPGWGFGYGWAVLDDPAAACTPQSKGTILWTGNYGNSWFVDPFKGITVVALTNTAFEGMWGKFTRDLRDAVYSDLAH